MSCCMCYSALFHLVLLLAQTWAHVPVYLSQNNVRTQACGAERPLRSREEHSAEEADEGTWRRVRIQRVTWVFGASWLLVSVWGWGGTGITVSQHECLILHWLVSVNLFMLRQFFLTSQRFTLIFIKSHITNDLLLRFNKKILSSQTQRETLDLEKKMAKV